MDEVVNMLKDGDDVDVCFMGFKKAVDLVNNRLLLVKLRALSFGEDSIVWVRAFVGNREFSVRVEGEVPEWVAVPSGVPQGSVLGSILFVVYINERPEEMRSLSFLFVDDLKKSEDLSEDLPTKALCAAVWDMQFSWSK